MRRCWIFIVLSLFAVALICIPLIEDEIPMVYFAWAGVILLLLLILLYKSVIKPLDVVSNGYDLLKAQDTANRLAKVGQYDADRIVELFNKLLQSLREERIKTIEQNNLLNLLISSSPVGIVIFDFDGNIDIANDTFTKMMGFDSISDVSGKTLDDIGGDALLLAGVQLGQSETLRPGGSKIWRCSRLSFMEKGFSRQFMIVERLTDEIVKAEKDAYGRVIRTLSHEVNNTLAGIIPVMDITASSQSDPEINEAIDCVIERCRSMASFVSSYADMMKIPQPQRVDVDIVDVIIQLRYILESLCDDSVKIEFDLPDAECGVNADPTLIEQVLINITKNAIESVMSIHTVDNPGFVRIQVNADIKTLTVIDNGAGISSENATNIFTPFFSTKTNGHGLGLMFVSETLRNHNFQFTLSTSQTDSLTRFTIKFK